MVIKRIGVVGFGHLGQFLVDEIKKQPTLELAFVWNRTKMVLEDSCVLKASDILEHLEDFTDRSCDLIVEVAHPSITFKYGSLFLKHCDFMIGSPSALADPELESALRDSAVEHGLYVPSGAFWGGDDIRKMSDRGTLKKLNVTMTKHPSSYKLEGHLSEICSQVRDKAITLYHALCALAPNNVNTMAAAAMAASNLGFAGVTGSIIADPNSLEWHIIEIEVTGPRRRGGQEFTVTTIRRNPADPGTVTGAATFGSFWSSLLGHSISGIFDIFINTNLVSMKKGAQGKGPGIHLC